MTHTIDIPLQVTYRGMSSSAALEHRISTRVARLRRTGARILDVRVSVEASRIEGRGPMFTVNAVARTSTGEVVASNDADQEDAYVALRDTMDALHRQILERRERRLERRRAPADLAQNAQLAQDAQM